MRLKLLLVTGGPAVDYAFIVHEDMNAKHKVGEPKYLERPFLEARGKVKRAVRGGLDAAIRKRT